MKELAALAYRDTTKENRDFWKNEMGNALREIQAAYDEKLEAMRAELEAYYNMKVQGQAYRKANSQGQKYIELDSMLTPICMPLRSWRVLCSYART